MDTSEQTVSRSAPAPRTARRSRPRRSRRAQPGVSIAAVALERRLNANLLRRWVVEAERTGTLPVRGSLAAPDVRLENGAGFVPVALSSSEREAAPIRIEVRRGSNTVSIEWPVAAARECAQLLRELMR